MSGKEQHTTPRLILRDFADDDGLIVEYDLRARRSFDAQPIREVAKKRHHHTVTDTTGVSTPVIDDWIGELENTAAPILQRFREGDLELQPAEVGALASFVALQIFRVPSSHQLWAENDTSLDRLRPYVDGVPPAFRGRNGANAKMISLVAWASREIAERYAIQIVRFAPHSLLTSDVPVVLIPSPWWGGSPITVSTAGTIFLGIGHATALTYFNREHKPDVAHLVAVAGNAEAAVAINQHIVAQSQRQVLWHPSTNAAALLGPDFKFPAYRERVAPEQTDAQTEKIARWAKWAAENPEEAAEYHSEHPLPNAMPANARPLSIETRKRLFGPST